MYRRLIKKGLILGVLLTLTATSPACAEKLVFQYEKAYDIWVTVTYPSNGNAPGAFFRNVKVNGKVEQQAVPVATNPKFAKRIQDSMNKILNGLSTADKQSMNNITIYIVEPGMDYPASTLVNEKIIVISTDEQDYSELNLAYTLSHELAHDLIKYQGKVEGTHTYRQSEVDADDLAEALARNAGVQGDGMWESAGYKNLEGTLFSLNAETNKQEKAKYDNDPLDQNSTEVHPRQWGMMLMGNTLTQLINSDQKFDHTFNYNGYDHKLTQSEFSQTYSGRYQKLSGPNNFAKAIYENMDDGLGQRTGLDGYPGKTFTAQYALYATVSDNSQIFTKRSEGTFNATMQGVVKGINGRPILGQATMTMGAATSGGTKFNLSGPLVIYPNGRMEFHPEGTFTLGGYTGSVIGDWNQKPKPKK